METGEDGVLSDRVLKNAEEGYKKHIAIATTRVQVMVEQRAKVVTPSYVRVIRRNVP